MIPVFLQFDKGVEGKYIQVLPLPDCYAQREFHIDQMIGKLSVGFLKLM